MLTCKRNMDEFSLLSHEHVSMSTVTQSGMFLGSWWPSGDRLAIGLDQGDPGPGGPLCSISVWVALTETTGELMSACSSAPHCKFLLIVLNLLTYFILFVCAVAFSSSSSSPLTCFTALSSSSSSSSVPWITRGKIPALLLLLWDQLKRNMKWSRCSSVWMC